MSEQPINEAASHVEAIPQEADKAVQVDKSIPEPVIGQLPASEQTQPPATIEEENPADKVKETEKPEDLARSLLKGFQNRIAGVFPKKTEKYAETKEIKKEESTEIKEEKKEEEKETKQRRSASRKRNSIFGNFGIGRKEEKPVSDESVPVETAKVSTSEPIKSTESMTEQEPKPDNTTTLNEPPTERPVPTKRSSIFDSFRYQFVKKEKSDNTSPVFKEPESVSTAAPVIPAVGSPELEKDDSKAEFITDKINATQATIDNKVEKLVTKAERRKSSHPFSLGIGKKEKTATPKDEETIEKPLSPFAKLRATVKSKTSSKTNNDKNEAAPVDAPVHEPVTEPNTDKAPETELPKPIISEPAAPAPVPEVAASA